MATHSSVLAWRIPWTEEPDGYSPWGRKESETTEHVYTRLEWTRGFAPGTAWSLGSGVF